MELGNPVVDVCLSKGDEIPLRFDANAHQRLIVSLLVVEEAPLLDDSVEQQHKLAGSLASIAASTGSMAAR